MIFQGEKLGGGFKHFFSHPFSGIIPILTNIFQMGWNHQLENLQKPLHTFLFLWLAAAHLGWWKVGAMVRSMDYNRNIPSV